eukprot:m.7509 g.7509  ORF g.7509 m.7509 type:complete len:307 (+) comp3725_c0_seq1:93-1013(+)
MQPLLIFALMFLNFRLINGRITGFHIDDETCSGLTIDGHTKPEQELLCAKFFASLSNITQLLKKVNPSLPGNPLTLTVDAGTGWVCTPGATNCFNLTYNGSTKSVAEHVVDLADFVVLMDYDRNESNVYTRALPYLTYADSINKKNSISVGLAVVTKGQTPAWWQISDEVALEALMVGSLPKLTQHPSFRQFSVFTDESWQSQQSSSNLSFQKTGVWYINHTIVLDSTLRTSWLEWARSRNITEVYIAPHASNVDLIGNPNNAPLFCSFIHLAESSYDINVELLTNPSMDIDFIRNCSRSNTHRNL